MDRGPRSVSEFCLVEHFEGLQYTKHNSFRGLVLGTLTWF